MSDYTKLTSEVLRLLCQQKSLSVQGNRQALISRLKDQDQNKRSASRSPAGRAKRAKTASTRTRSAAATPVVDFTDQPDDQVEFTVPDSNEMVEEPHTESQPAITVDQITSIVSAIVESKMATLASTGSNIPGQAAPSTVAPNINFGDPNSVQQLLPSQSSHSGDFVVHVDEKTRKAILKSEYVDFVRVSGKPE